MPVPKVTEAHRDARRNQIVDAALDCFAQKGFQGASMADIFEASGLSAGAVYSYFPSKRELAVATATRVLEVQLQRVGDHADTHVAPAPSRVIRSLAEGFEEAGLPTRVIIQVWGEAATAPELRDLARGALASVGATFRLLLTRWAVETKGMGEDAAAAFSTEVHPAMMALAQGYLLQSALVPDFDLDAYVRGVERILG